jgi:SAM-dependent methyltransferase
VAATRARVNAKVTLIRANAASLDFPAGAFDLVLQATVFTSILDRELQARVAGEMMRVVKPGGLILWYDYYRDNPSNPDVRGVKRAEIHSLFPGCAIELERLTLAPPLARRVAPFSFLACFLLEKIPWLCTHYLGAIRKGEKEN